MKTSRSMWLGVIGVFVLMACAWTAMFFFAGKAKVESVPVVNASETHVGWNALSPTRSEEARPGRVERLEDKSLHPATETR